ncbi:MAG: 50S ribosomal protein L6 [Lentisphaerae bacterium]|nr:50S ribosomal protein L6 [Lentisphaerota bacterium]
MSRIGQEPIDLPAGVTVSVEGKRVSVKGPLGELAHTAPAPIDVATEDGRITVTRVDDTDGSRSLHGLTRTLVANMVEGVTKGFSKTIEIEGVGFRAAVDGQALDVSVGFPAPVRYKIPEGITVDVQGGTTIVVSGADKQMVGNSAALIRGISPAEPYKGKGLHYRGERVRRKVGKTVA